MATFIVSTLNDSGAGSLRAAIEAANAAATPSIIRFTVAGTIQLASDLPRITAPVTIDGLSAPGAVLRPTVEIDFNGHAGLVVSTGGGGSSVIGLALGNASGNGVTLLGSGVTLDKNYIGLHADGSAFGNLQDGIAVTTLSADNKIGLNASGVPGVVGNVISGNGGNGIGLYGSNGNVIVANHIGTSPDGNAALGNGQHGIFVTEGASGNTIGGTLYVNPITGAVNNPTGDKGTVPATFVVPPLGNLVSGNGSDGILINGGAKNNVLNGNFVGTTANGNAALGNAGDGVHIVDAPDNSLIGCTFVDNPFVYYNVLSGNGGNGLHLTNADNTTVHANFFGAGANNATVVANKLNGILVDGSSQNVQVGGVIPLGNVSAGNGQNGIYVTDTVSGFITFNTFGGLFAFQGAAPNGNDGILIDSTGGNNTIRTNVFSGNLKNGIEIAGNASGVTVDPNIVGLDTTGGSKTVTTGIGLPLMANGANGLLITGTAHDNVIGGYTQSVIPENTFSGNLGYGVAITGAAYDNKVFNSAIGLDTLLLKPLGNTAGGVLLATSGGGNVIGGTTTNPAKPVANYIGGNGGDGISLAGDSTGQAIIGNVIGLDRAGLPVAPNGGLPLALNGSLSTYVVGNTGIPSSPTIGLPPQEVMSQLEGLYIGFYGRAGDSTGVEYWMNKALAQMEQGASISQAMISVSSSFATSAENGRYAALATQPLNPNNPQQVALATSFIQQVYQNAFNHAADAGGLQYWLQQLFSGAVSYSALTYTIEASAQAADQATLGFKLAAGTYFTEATAGSTPSAAAMVGAVRQVGDMTSYLLSKTVSAQYQPDPLDQTTYATAFSDFVVTGVRALYDGKVVLTGTEVIDGVSTAALYSGPMQDTALGTLYAVSPQFAGQTVTKSTFYGPNTSIFTPSIGVGNVVAVGSYNYSTSTVANHGMMYSGPISGGGTWTQIDVPSAQVGGKIVEDTIPHSTMGDLVVGNYDLQGVPASGNAFVYNARTGTYQIFGADFGGTDQLTTAYAIWQNGIGSTSYTIAGGSKHGTSVNDAFLVNYDSLTQVFSNLKFYQLDNVPGLISHFEGMTAVPGGFNVIGQGIADVALAFIGVSADGSFGDAHWTDISVPGSALTTGNSVFQNIGMGIYTVPGTAGSSTYTVVVDQSHVSDTGGLLMPIGAMELTYATTVAGSTGALVVGSKLAGNLLGGSIGNDVFVGTSSTAAPDTIYTGGGADLVLLSTGRSLPTRVELYAGNSLEHPLPVGAGGVQWAVAHSIVDANDIPQLGWWGQASAKLGGPVSDVTTNRGHGTGISSDMSIVTNFNAGSGLGQGDTVDLSLSAFSNLLRSVDPLAGPALGTAVFSNLLQAGSTVTTSNADVLVFGQAYANAAALASALANPATGISFGTAQTNAVNHYLVAYQDLVGNVRLADMDIHSATPFTNTGSATTLAVSDMAQLVGVSITQLQPSNIHFVA